MRHISLRFMVALLVVGTCWLGWGTQRAVFAGDNSGPADLLVLGAIHDGHRTSKLWGTAELEAVIRRYRPDAVLCEIPPGRWPAAWHEYREQGTVSDSRIKRFPEYTDVVLPLAVEMGFEVVPCAAWTEEMAAQRRERIHRFTTEPEYADRNAAYAAAEKAAARADSVEFATSGPYADLDDIDDPWYIHTVEYDRRIKAELAPYDRYLDDFIGPGGWTNINMAHMELIDDAIAARPGQRLLLIFGAGHKYWFLEHLQGRSDVRLVRVLEYLGSRPPLPERDQGP